MPTWSQYWFNDGISPTMEEFISFHDYVFLASIFIVVAVFMTFIFMISNSSINLYLAENQAIEWIWTLTPAIILLFVAIPSLSLLYMYDEHMNYSVSTKAIGHQWFWSYEMMKIAGGMLDMIEMDCYMVSEKFLPLGKFRILETDNHLMIPSNTPVQMLITSNDVIHSWTIPSLGVKADAIPGRLNLLSLFSYHTGIFYGQCSEICGANHSFMPITLEIISSFDYMAWLISNN